MPGSRIPGLQLGVLQWNHGLVHPWNRLFWSLKKLKGTPDPKPFLDSKKKLFLEVPQGKDLVEQLSILNRIANSH